jgi:hypothetical protein
VTGGGQLLQLGGCCLEGQLQVEREGFLLLAHLQCKVVMGEGKHLVVWIALEQLLA